MAIQIGAAIKAISERKIAYMEGNVTQTLYIRDVAFEIVGMPTAVNPVPTFAIAVTDATQWNTLAVGQTCTITIEPPP
jgi:hypothetical protein